MTAKPVRHPGNVPGPWYVDTHCITCGLCDNLVPAVFRLNAQQGVNEVFHQPATREEFQLAGEALEECPVEAIHKEVRKFESGGVG